MVYNTFLWLNLQAMSVAWGQVAKDLVVSKLKDAKAYGWKYAMKCI